MTNANKRLRMEELLILKKYIKLFWWCKIQKNKSIFRSQKNNNLKENEKNKEIMNKIEKVNLVFIIVVKIIKEDIFLEI